jgi:hypothetical protein
MGKTTDATFPLTFAKPASSSTRPSAGAIPSGILKGMHSAVSMVEAGRSPLAARRAVLTMIRIWLQNEVN